MIKEFYICLVLSSLLTCYSACAQFNDQLISEIDQLNDACKSNWFSDTNLAIELGISSSEKALAIGYSEGLATAYNNLGVAFWVRGELDRALGLYYQSINVRDTIGGDFGLANTYHNIGNAFRDRKNFTESQDWYNKALSIRYRIKDSLGISYSINNLGLIAQAVGRYDSADYFLNQSLKIRESLQDVRGIATSHMSLGQLQVKLNNLNRAEQFFLEALKEWESIQHSQGQANTYIELAKLSRIENNFDELQGFVSKGLAVAKSIQAKPQLLELYQLSAESYLQAQDTVNAFEQLQQAYNYRIDIYDQQREGMIQQYNMDQAAHANELLKKENLLQKEQILRQRDSGRTTLIIIIFLLALLFLLYRLLRDRVKSNKSLTASNKELKLALEELKKTQSQLVQAEKMASLGTLTAGVSHEINNPLNFVMGAYHGLSEYFKTNTSTDKEITDGLLNGIQLSVKRISKIVQGLNQFSRTNEEMNEACDIHLIIDNCLTMLSNRLKKKVILNKQYSKSAIIVKGNVGKLHQVFLNIISNGIDAIHENGNITISTELSGSKIIVKCIDNGMGISKMHIHQVTDPFFTTKPPGEGTGLGLSIVNTIVMDHGGSLSFESEDTQGTTVKIEFPVSDNEHS